MLKYFFSVSKMQQLDYEINVFEVNSVLLPRVNMASIIFSLVCVA